MTAPSTAAPAPASFATDVRAFCKRAWWIFLIGGITSVLFGILALFNPGIALLVLAIFFAAHLLVDGVASVWGAATHRDKEGWWMVLLLGGISVFLGLYLLAVPPLGMLALIYLVAFNAMMVGLTLLWLGIKIRRLVTGEWMLYLTGIVSLLFGFLILLFPAIGGLSVVYMVAFWAIVVGVARIAIAFKVKNLRDSSRELLDEATTA